MKKKTYVFDEDMLYKMEELRKALNKKEIAILKEALDDYYYKYKRGANAKSELDMLVNKIDSILNKVEELSYKLGKCEERNKYLQKELNKIE